MIRVYSRYHHDRRPNSWVEEPAHQIATETEEKDEAQKFALLAIADAITDLADAIREQPTDKPITVGLRINTDPAGSDTP
jgi:hypothetical protein